MAIKADVQVWKLHTINIQDNAVCDLPLFLVCVRTNVGYCTIAEFVTQSETAKATGEALKILRVESRVEPIYQV